MTKIRSQKGACCETIDFYSIWSASFEEAPYVVAVCQRKAVLEGFLGKNSEKLATLEHGLRLDCNHAGLNVEKARVLNDMGRSDEANIKRRGGGAHHQK